MSWKRSQEFQTPAKAALSQGSYRAAGSTTNQKERSTRAERTSSRLAWPSCRCPTPAIKEMLKKGKTGIWKSRMKPSPKSVNGAKAVAGSNRPTRIPATRPSRI